PSSSDWKNTIATDHTAGEPPSRGSNICVNSGCTENKSSALTKMAAVSTASTSRFREADNWSVAANGLGAVMKAPGKAFFGRGTAPAGAGRAQKSIGRLCGQCG